MGSGPSEPSVVEATALRCKVDGKCAEAARVIAAADVLLLCTGAGFSADSGLAVYADVARIPVYANRNLTYHDLCQPHWLDKEPDLFWGFWGQCFNDYRETPPHEGYSIIDRWADRWFRRSPTARRLRDALAARWKGLAGGEPEEPYRVEEPPGAFFCVHFKRGRAQLRLF